MSKLTLENKFIDVSDYGRPIAKFIARRLKNTNVNAVHITLLFGLSGILAIYCIAEAYYWTAGFFLVLKSILDAADGELARVKAEPSFVGRYLDSIFDSLLNFAFLISIAWFSDTNFWCSILAFVCMQTQGTLYNYYHVILRHSTAGEITSQIFEKEAPAAYPQEKQSNVNFLFNIYRLLYRVFDELIYKLDPLAFKASIFPKWFMMFVSFYGLGFQLLIMAFFLAMGWIGFVIPFFIAYSILIPLLITIRIKYLK